MVSTRSQSVLSADEARGDPTAGEVNSTPATVRRSGRTSGGTSGKSAPPRSTRTVRTRRQLGVIEEERGQLEEQPATQEVCAADAAGTGEDGAELATAKEAVVDVLAQHMFDTLEGAFGQQLDGSSDSDSDGGSHSSEQPGETAKGHAAAGAAARRQGTQEDEVEEGSSSGSDDDDSGVHQVPEHLRWRPDLVLPGMAERQQQGIQASASTAAAGMPGVGVHAVGKSKGSLHVLPPDERVRQRIARKAAPDTAGKGWFDLPATQITDEVKNDLRLLRLRGALDPKAFYKKFDTTKFPKYFQMGTVVEGAADFYSGRLTNKQRKRTFTEEIMADPQLAEARKKRYTKLQEERASQVRKKHGRKTNNERKKKPHHRPKH